MPAKIILYEDLPAGLLARLEESSDMTVLETFEGVSDKVLHSLLSGAEGLIGVGEKIGPKILDRAPNLRVVSTISVGYDYFDVADLTRRGIMLMHTPNVLTDTTADMIFMLMLCTARRTMSVWSANWCIIPRAEHQRENSLEVKSEPLSVLMFFRV